MKLEDLKGKTVGVCVSGGLDSKTICCVLKDAGVKVKAFSANVGQPDEADINDIKKKMAPTGVSTTIVDVTKEMADICCELGMVNGVHLDGGGSAQILLKNHRSLRTSDRNLEDNSDAERPIPLALMLK
jgi:argininosuccinate synthase